MAANNNILLHLRGQGSQVLQQQPGLPFFVSGFELGEGRKQLARFLAEFAEDDMRMCICTAVSQTPPAKVARAVAALHCKAVSIVDVIKGAVAPWASV